MPPEAKAILFDGEQVTLNLAPSRPAPMYDKDAINAKYAKGEVRIVTEQARYSVTTVVGMYESLDYKLNPDFQRRHRWGVEKQSRLIESFIMNVPIPPIFLYEVEFSQYEVMDGVQRMTAIHDFYADKFALAGLEEWKELNGYRYSQLPDHIRKGIDRRYLSSIILLQETAKTPEEALRLKQLVFERINTGGVQLTFQESRNAIYDGPLNRLCIRLARNPYFCRLWDIPEPSQDEIEKTVYSDELIQNETFRRMDDVELVLRFFAYRQRLNHEQTSLKTFLDEFLKQGNRFELTLLKNYETLFTQTVQLVYDTLGETAFYMYRQRKSGTWNWFNRPTRVLYEPIMHAFSLRVSKATELRAKSDVVRKALSEFYRDKYDLFGGRQVNLSDMAARNEAFLKFLDTFVA
jgi:hypothetical protein